MTKIRTLVVDDEPMARERVRSLLAGQPDIEIVAECADGPQAVRGDRAAQAPSWCSSTCRCRTSTASA